MTLVVDDLDEVVTQKLESLARLHGRTPAEEAREILRAAMMLVPAEDSEGFGTRFSSYFKDVGLEEDIKEWRGYEVVPPKFD